MRRFKKIPAFVTFVVLFSLIKSHSVPTEVSDTELGNNENHTSDDREPPDDQLSEYTFHYDDFENGVDLMLGKGTKTDHLEPIDDDETVAKSIKDEIPEIKDDGDKSENRINENSSSNNRIPKREDTENDEIPKEENDTSKQGDPMKDITERDYQQHNPDESSQKGSNPSNDENVLPPQSSGRPSLKDNEDLANDDESDQKALLELEKDGSWSEKQEPKQSDYVDINQVLDNSDSIDDSRFVPDLKPKYNEAKTKSGHNKKKINMVSKKEYLHRNTDSGTKSNDFLENGVFGSEPSNKSLDNSVSQWAVEYNSSDTKLWIGIGVGVAVCLTIVAFVISVLLFLRKRRGCSQWKKLKESSFNHCVKDDKPIYIKLSQLHGKRQNNGSNYVITVLDESNFSVDSSWSSEEELFGVSDILNRTKDKSFCKTSTPLRDKSFRT